MDAAPKLNRALPTWAIDAIRLGPQGKDGHDSRRVWGMAVSIAMSAQKRGWSQQDYINEIVRHESRLWHQLCTGKKGRARSEGSSYKSLDKAWEEARLHLADAGERTRDDIKADAIELAFMWTDRLVDNVDNLTANEIAVMQYVICQTEERGMFKVTCPVREVGKFAKVSIKTASRILGALTDKGMLNRYSRGTHSANGTGKASIYGLMDLMMWESRQAPVASGLPLGEYEVDESAGFAPPGPPAYPIDNISTNNPILPIDLDPTDTTRHPEGEAGGQTEESEGEESENLTTGCQPPSVTHRHGGILPYVSFSCEVPVDHVADLTTSVVPAPNFLCLTQS